MDTIHVGIGDFAVASGDCQLVTVLGSCVGLVCYDKFHRIAGLAHIYLPDSTIGFRLAASDKPHLLSESPKYADLLVPRLIGEMTALGAETKHFLTYIVGGASLYDFPEDSPLNVGKKNLDMTRRLLSGLGLRFMEIKVGGTRGRHLTFNVTTGDINVREFSGDK